MKVGSVPEKKISVLLVDDHSIVRMGFATLLGLERDIEIVAEAEDSEQAVAAYARHRPDVVLMDVRMPGVGGVEALERILVDDPEARVIMLTTYDLEQPVIESVEHGASGYLLKSVTRDELVASVRLVAGGGRCFPASVESQLARNELPKRLTPRETETLTLLRRGLSNKEIGSALGVSENTAKAHVKAILQKLGVVDRAEAVAAGFERGLLEIE